MTDGNGAAPAGRTVVDDMVLHRAVAARALACLDLTDLSDACDAAAVEALCTRAATRHGPVAAVCLWPRFVAQARGILGPNPAIRIATVVNFPSGDGTIAGTEAEARAAVAAGADEVDVVIPYRALMAGNGGAVDATVAAVRAACPTALIKTILESGVLADDGLIAEASRRAIAAGADMLKTSTGKVAVNATPEAVATMLRAIREGGRPVGLKAAGGIGTTAVAGRYLALADDTMGPGWAKPATFRFGASGLLDDLLAVLDGRPTGRPATGY